MVKYQFTSQDVEHSTNQIIQFQEVINHQAIVIAKLKNENYYLKLQFEKLSLQLEIILSKQQNSSDLLEIKEEQKNQHSNQNCLNLIEKKSVQDESSNFHRIFLRTQIQTQDDNQSQKAQSNIFEQQETQNQEPQNIYQNLQYNNQEKDFKDTNSVLQIDNQSQASLISSHSYQSNGNNLLQEQIQKFQNSNSPLFTDDIEDECNNMLKEQKFESQINQQISHPNVLQNNHLPTVQLPQNLISTFQNDIENFQHNSQQDDLQQEALMNFKVISISSKNCSEKSKQINENQEQIKQDLQIEFTSQNNSDEEVEILNFEGFD